MNNKKYNLLAIGSCRICTVLNKYQNTYNTWAEVGKRNITTNTINIYEKYHLHKNASMLLGFNNIKVFGGRDMGFKT